MTMQRIDIGRWTLEADPVATASAYASLDKGGADECTCADCQYYRNHRDTILPTALREILDPLGIDFQREAETWCVDLGEGQARYSGWFHFFGRLVEGRDGWKATDEHRATADFQKFDGFELAFTKRLALVPPVFSGNDLVQVEFSITVKRPASVSSSAAPDKI
jgi:hypothetical protein